MQYRENPKKTPHGCASVPSGSTQRGEPEILLSSYFVLQEETHALIEYLSMRLFGGELSLDTPNSNEKKIDTPAPSGVIPTVHCVRCHLARLTDEVASFHTKTKEALKENE